MPTNPEVQARRIATTQRRIDDAQTAKTKHAAHITRLDKEIAAHQRELEWLKSMPVDEVTDSTDEAETAQEINQTSTGQDPA